MESVCKITLSRWEDGAVRDDSD